MKTQHAFALTLLVALLAPGLVAAGSQLNEIPGYCQGGLPQVSFPADEWPKWTVLTRGVHYPERAQDEIARLIKLISYEPRSQAARPDGNGLPVDYLPYLELGEIWKQIGERECACAAFRLENGAEARKAELWPRYTYVGLAKYCAEQGSVESSISFDEYVEAEPVFTGDDVVSEDIQISFHSPDDSP